MNYIFLSVIYTAPPNFTLSLNGTVLTASWDAPALQYVSYTLTCSVDSNEVLSLSTTLTEVVVGIYMTKASYSCNVYATISGVDKPATDDMSVTTGGRPKHKYMKTKKSKSVCFLPDSSEPAYLPFIPRLSENNVLTTGLNVVASATTVTFPFGKTSFTTIYVSNMITACPLCLMVLHLLIHQAQLCFNKKKVYNYSSATINVLLYFLG